MICAACNHATRPCPSCGTPICVCISDRANTRWRHHHAGRTEERGPDRYRPRPPGYLQRNGELVNQLIMLGFSVGKIAYHTGVSKRTVWRWLGAARAA